MNLNDLLAKKDIDPTKVLVLRHRPKEPEILKLMPWWAEERPDMYNAFQQTHDRKLEGAMQKRMGDGFVASFIGTKPAKALFVGLYSIKGGKQLTFDEYWKVPAYKEMKALGMIGWEVGVEQDRTTTWFDLQLQADFYPEWKGKLIVDWPPPERSWWRRAEKNVIPVASILEESALVPGMPEWTEIDFSWALLNSLPTEWRNKLSQWRGIYYIFDSSDGKGYVGSAYGSDNILGRWLNYSKSGHGGNQLLRSRDPKQFRFSILQRVSPDSVAEEVIQLEASWKHRLHTREPHGLNGN